MAKTRLNSVAGAVTAFGLQGAMDRYYGGGDVLWVGNRSGLPSGDGSAPNYPLATIGGANGALAKLQATTNRGHMIFVMPGHAENVSSADYFSAQGAADTFAIVGITEGVCKPSLTWTTATSSVLMDTSCMFIDGFQLFLAGAHAAGAALTVAAPITVSAAGCGIVNCDIAWGFDADQIVSVGINLGTAADFFKFNENNCYAETAAVPTTTFLRLNGADHFECKGTRVIGPGSTVAIGPVQMLTTGSLKVDIRNSVFQNTLAASTHAFTALAGSTGNMSNCSLGVLAAGNGITTGSGIQVMGTYVAVAGAAGTLATG